MILSSYLQGTTYSFLYEKDNGASITTGCRPRGICVGAVLIKCITRGLGPVIFNYSFTNTSSSFL